VVLYDRQVHARLLRYARPDAETIDVGGAAPQPLEQEAICYLLAEKAREGRTVARLKWGDPFFFDSGGSEALFLHEQGVRYEVIPGIPAGIAAPAYAGIPITYPGGGDTVSFVRGHEDGGKTKASVDWSSLANLDGSIVCYAGPDRVPELLQTLLSHGRPAGDSAAIVYGGTGRSKSWSNVRPTPTIAGRRSSSLAVWRGCASTCGGSTRGRFSASACW
jgi:uroporphyrinogen III methyltransferase/synthase